MQNLTPVLHEQVDRYIRDLDRAIKEQETSLSLGLRPGTHPASIILPEIVLPKSLRAPRVMDESPAPSDIAEPSAPAPSSTDTELTLGTIPTETANNGGASPPPPPPPPPTPPVRRRIRPKKWTRQKQRTAEVKGNSKMGTPVGEESAPQRPVLKLTVPPLAAVAQQQQQEDELAAQEEIDPSEERYCYCGMVSFGTVRFLSSPQPANCRSLLGRRWSRATAKAVRSNGCVHTFLPRRLHSHRVVFTARMCSSTSRVSVWKQRQKADGIARNVHW